MEKNLDENRLKWDSFADKDALFYIDTSAKTSELFWKKGEDNFRKYILPILKKHRVGRGIGVDFGCGIGRHTFPMSRYFKTVYGIDVSDGMLKRARAEAEKRSITNAPFINNDELFRSKTPVDFFYSVNVFQHIEDMAQARSILEKLASSLKGLAYIQFDTRPHDLSYRLKNHLPDIMLPRSQRRGIRRIRRSAEDIKDIMGRSGLLIIAEQNPQSASHFFLLKKSP